MKDGDMNDVPVYVNRQPCCWRLRVTEGCSRIWASVAIVSIHNTADCLSIRDQLK